MEDEVRKLYGDLLAAWNRRDPEGYAALFTSDAVVVGFDGSQERGADLVAHLTPIFDGHPTAAYVAAVRGVRPLGADRALLWAAVGMVPPHADRVNPAVNTVQTLVAERQPLSVWRVVLFQNTPAQYHGRPELAEAHTREMQAIADRR